MNPLITTDEVKNGELLADLDDAEYRLVSVVYKLNGVDKATFYCSAVDWPQTEAGRIAKYAAEVERLRMRILELESKPITVEEALKISAPNPPDLYCVHCHQQLASVKGYKAHMRIKHGER